MLEYRNAPIDKNTLSAAQVLFGRRLNSQLPYRNALLNPANTNTNMSRYIKASQEKQKKYFDTNARDNAQRRGEKYAETSDSDWTGQKNAFVCGQTDNQLYVHRFVETEDSYVQSN